MGFSINYIETCYPDFLQDHHNRENERLISIGLYGQSSKEAARDLIDEINGCDMGIPEEVTEGQLGVAAREAVEGLTFFPYDAEGNEAKSGCKGWDEIVENCESMAYFYATWDGEDDE